MLNRLALCPVMFRRYRKRRIRARRHYLHRSLAPRARKVRVLATLGPASNTPEMIEKLIRAGADAFRINMSHGVQADHAAVIAATFCISPAMAALAMACRAAASAEWVWVFQV